VSATVDYRGEVEQLRELVVQLQTALDSRVVIEQAKGILAERYSLRTDGAFELLRRAARSNRLSIHTLAAEVVANGETPEEIRRIAAAPWRAHAPRGARAAGERIG
jgi:AmiR/NasT family two-component response regulator